MRLLRRVTVKRTTEGRIYILGDAKFDTATCSVNILSIFQR